MQDGTPHPRSFAWRYSIQGVPARLSAGRL